MLKHFFEAGSDGRLFEGLDISREKKLCDAFMGKFPVISITLKSARGENFNEAKGMFRNIIGNETLRFQFLADSGSLTGIEQKRYEALINIDESGAFTMSDELLKDSLRLMSQLLQKHYGQSVVMIIDEYDVPLDRAYQSGYYDAMVEFIRILFENPFKTNDSLNFAVLTGCLRISKERIFSGFNNLKVFTAKDVRYMEYFGFTDGEVRQMLQYYGLTSQYDAIKEWYDGYLFGSQEIYCPWDVINYCGDLFDRSVAKPQNYWVNTSSNSIIRSFLEKADGVTKNEIERLIGGESIKKKIRQELTYRDLDSKIDNLWSILFTTGYLTQRGEDDNGMTGLVSQIQCRIGGKGAGRR